MSAGKPVRACLCYPHTFAELKRLAETHGWHTVEEITAARGCGGGCGLCRPYLAKMLATGETAFAVIPPKEKRPSP
jgi:bacterioferritin-associated ferredoxin